MSVYLFLGPTLGQEDVPANLGAICLPPVTQGDVYRAVLARPRAIGIIDGYFGGAPAIWHKEILWALSEGIHVFGSASMGALRAAELHTFGMRGVGRIFEMFRDGSLEDDDEVAVTHGPAETNFTALSESMVNVRFTLANAEVTGILGKPSRSRIEKLAKSLFFADRNWPAILGEAARLGVPETAALQEWLPHGRVDQKRADALEMLRAMQLSPAQLDPHDPRFRFEWTQLWDELVTRTKYPPKVAGAQAPSSAQKVVEELRLEGRDAYERARKGAALRLFAEIEAKRHGLRPNAQAVRATLTRFRSGLGLFNRSRLEAWLIRNETDAASLERLIEKLTCSEEAIGLWSHSLEPEVADELRLHGAYERLATRVRQKEDALAKVDDTLGELDPATLNPIALRRWYFEERLGQTIPDNVDTYAREMGFADLENFDSALQREWLYLNLMR